MLVVGPSEDAMSIWAIGSMVALLFGTLVGAWRADQATTDVLGM